MPAVKLVATSTQYGIGDATSGGYFTVSNPDAFIVGAYCWISKIAGRYRTLSLAIRTLTTRCVVVSKSGGAIGLRFQEEDEIPADPRILSDLSAYTFRSVLVQPEQVVVEDSNNDGIPDLDGVAGSATQSEATYILVDNENGSDANPGRVDAALGSVLASDATVPVKTVARFKELVAQVGNGKAVVGLFKNRSDGSVYKKADGVTADDLDLKGYTNYAGFSVFGSTDLTNSTTDRILSGFITASTGPNLDGSWTAGAGSTSGTVVLQSGSFPTGTTITGMRVRFKGNVTAGLALKVRAIQSGNTTSTLVLKQNFDELGLVVAPGDEFFIERPGVLFNTIGIKLDGNSSFTSTGTTAQNRGFGIRGIGSLSNFQVYGWTRRLTIGGCEVRGGRFDVEGPQLVQIQPDPRHEAGSTSEVGFGIRTSSTTNTFSGCQSVTVSSSAFLSADAFVSSFRYFFGSCTFGRGFVDDFSGTAIKNSWSVSALSSWNFVGAQSISGRWQPSVFLGTPQTSGVGVVNVAGNMSLRDVVWENAGANPLVKVVGDGCRIRLEGCTGSGGNSDVGLDLSLAYNAQIVAGEVHANTFAGTVGDIRLGDDTVIPHALLTTDEVIDTQSNHLLGTAGAKISRVTSGVWFNVPQVSSDPASPLSGDVWFRSDLSEIRVRSGSTTYKSAMSLV